MSRSSIRSDTRFSAAQTRAARGLLGWSLERLADVAAVEADGLRQFEADEIELDTLELEAVGSALYIAGAMPIPADLAGEGVRLRRPDNLAPNRRRTSFVGPAQRLPDWLPLGDGDASNEGGR